MSSPANRPKEIEITIPADGSNPNLEMLGYEGTECSAEAKEVISILDAKDVGVKRKPEYFRVKNKNNLKNKR